MKSKLWFIAALLFCVPANLRAQQETPRNLVLPLADGGYVAFKSQTAWSGKANASNALQQLPGDLRAETFADDSQVIHRVLMNGAGQRIFGYDLLIQPVPATKTFTIEVRPLDRRVESKLLVGRVDSQPGGIATLPESAEPQVLDDGDSFTLDLLVNEKLGVKIVDFVKVSFDRNDLLDSPRTLPRDFTLDAVAMHVVDFRLIVDGTLVAAGKPGTDFGGALLWCYVEGQGRFIFSLVPREGYAFAKVGTVSGDRIEFTMNGRRFEWLSSTPILASDGAWNLWVLHDPKYVPFGTQQASTRKKSKLDKWDDSIQKMKQRARKGADPSASAFHQNEEPDKNTQPLAVRFRVMVGAADSMENLLPR